MKFFFTYSADDEGLTYMWVIFLSYKKFKTDDLKKYFKLKQGLAFVEKIAIDKWVPINDKDDSEGYHFIVSDDFNNYFAKRTVTIDSLDILTKDAEWALNERKKDFLEISTRLFKTIKEVQTRNEENKNRLEFVQPTN